METKLNLILKVTCDHCGREYELRVNMDDYQSWKLGETQIQDAFPYLNPSERELILSHCCGECWNRIMSTEDPMSDDGSPLDINDYV